ncbi:MAG: hypothetical protein IH591_18205 [Bacteroidales bacterium]|nr:hypothetical protein [Bacteroidales bacterium]
MGIGSRRITASAAISILLLLAIDPVSLWSQEITSDTIVFIRRGSIIKTQAGFSIIAKDSTFVLPSSLKLINARTDQGSRVYSDSLMAKAMRTSFGKRLYDMVIVEPESYDSKVIRNRSLEDFEPFNGLLVSSIRILRLDPFGSNLLDPEYSSEKRSDKFLNRTHVLTRENIIAKYLLFAKGDTITGLALSESERTLRNLRFINDVRIVVVPISEYEADIIVITRDDYSAGVDFSYRNPDVGEFSLFERNLAGRAHSLDIGLPYNMQVSNRFGIRVNYSISNIARSFADLDVFMKSTYKERSYGFNLSRDFISAESDYAGGITVKEVYTTTDVDTSPRIFPLEYTYQDYWLARSVMIDRESLARLIFGVRYINNNVFERPEIDPLSYYRLQKYRLYLASASFSIQKFYKTSFIFNYGRTEDIPYGGLAVFTAGREFNEFKSRTYVGSAFSWGNSPGRIGYFNISAGASAFILNKSTEQGVIDMSMNYFTGLITGGNWKVRGFLSLKHTRGFDRYSDEYLTLGRDEMVTGFTNDSIRGQQRSVINIETVAFSPLKISGFTFAFFGFTDLAWLGKGYNQLPGSSPVKGIGAGVRVRNNNLIINTFQLRLTWYPGIPPFSDTHYLNVSGEQVLNHRGFDAGPPALIVYR